MDALSLRFIPQERNKNKGYGGRSKSKGISKSLGKEIRKCWKWSKDGEYKKDCIYKSVDKEKRSKDTPST